MSSLTMTLLLRSPSTIRAFSRNRPSLTAFTTGSHHHTSTVTSKSSSPLFRHPFQARPVVTVSTSSARRLSSETAAAEVTDKESKKAIPITLLSGFLGAGKTTALKHLLENRDGLRVAVVVNDVASVNIDAKLIANPDNKNYDSDDESDILADGGTVELQNGCACCSLADELLTSVEKLVTGRDFDAVVVELSGVADPVSVRQNWEQAELVNHPVTKLATVNKIVTVIDSSTFGTDWMTWSTAGERQGWTEEGDDCAGLRKVPELLAEQVEAADVLLVNKVDLAGEVQVATASSVARGLNKKAELFETSFGKVAAKELIAMMSGVVVEKEKKEEEGHSHSHGHDHESSCDDPKCEDESHSHAHSHDHAAASSCTEPGCTDESHTHSHSHDHDASCADPGCTDTSHSHSHDHDASCADPGCTDTSHSHSHDHSSTSTSSLGITSFVYKSPKPFDALRLMTLLNQWPVPIKDDLDLQQLRDAVAKGYQITDEGEKATDSPFVGVLRSKGFCWLAPVKWTGRGADKWRHDTAMYWSHAGKHFGITTAGKWWGTIDKETMKKYFTLNMKEYERILAEDFASEEFGDRRQELVFIGADLDEGKITDALNECLCNDVELDAYRQQLKNFMDSTLNVEAASGPSLFDTAGTDHMDVEK